MRGNNGRYLLFIGIGVALVVMAFFLRGTSDDDEAVCNDLAARALAASTPGAASAVVPLSDDELQTFVKCVQERR